MSSTCKPVCMTRVVKSGQSLVLNAEQVRGAYAALQNGEAHPVLRRVILPEPDALRWSLRACVSGIQLSAAEIAMSFEWFGWRAADIRALPLLGSSLACCFPEDAEVVCLGTRLRDDGGLIEGRVDEQKVAVYYPTRLPSRLSLVSESVTIEGERVFKPGTYFLGYKEA